MEEQANRKPSIEESEEELNRNLRENIKRFRLAAGMTQAKLAELVGYADKSMIAKIESGKTNPPLDKLRAFAKALQVNVFELAFAEGQVRILDEEEEEVAIWDIIQRKEANCSLLHDPVVVPILLHELPDTENLYAKENIFRYVAVPDWIRCDFAITALDESMRYAGILKYSEVFIQDGEVEQGELAAVLIGDEQSVRIRRIYYGDNLLTLQAAHPDFAPLVFTGDAMDDVWILGKAVYVLNALQ